MTAQELKAIAEGLAPVVRDQIQKALEQERATFNKTIVGLEQRLLEIETTPGESIKGDTGPAGPAGKDAEPVNIPSLIAAVLAAMPDPEKGDRGDAGRDGKDAPAVDVEALVARVAGLMPVPKDGRDGKDAPPVDIEAIVSKVAALTPIPKDGANGKDGVGLTGAFIGLAGHLIVTLSDGTAKDVGIIVGKDGESGRDGSDVDMRHVEQLINEAVAKIPPPKDGRDGADGLGFDDTDLVLDEVKGYVFRLTNGDRTKDYPVPWPWDAKIWQAGRDYFKGASVTWDGHFWIAQRATSEQPGEGSTAWRLAVRRGKQGREGKKGDKGDPAPPQGPVFG